MIFSAHGVFTRVPWVSCPTSPGCGASEQKSFSLTDPAALAMLFAVLTSASGVSVTAASALRLPPVRRTVSLIAESIATLPFKAYAESNEVAKAAPRLFAGA